MKLYVAGYFQSYRKVRTVIDSLKSLGHTITYDWTRCPELFGAGGDLIEHTTPLSKIQLSSFAMRDRQGVAEAEAIVVCADEEEKHVGTYIEMGMALARARKCFLIGPPVYTVFFDLPEVTTFNGYADFFRHMEDSSDSR